MIGGYIINREYTDQTLKNILTVPISLPKLLTGKLIVLGVFTIILSFISFICTAFLGVLFFPKGMTAFILCKSLVQIMVVNICCYIAVLPIVAYFGRKQNSFLTGVGLAFVYGFCGIFVAGRNMTDLYPITAGLGITGYQNDAENIYHPMIGFVTLLIILLVTALILSLTPKYDKIMSTTNKRRKHN